MNSVYPEDFHGMISVHISSKGGILKNMKIYISHSTLFDYKKDLYQPIRNSQLNKVYEFILPHEESDEPYPSKRLFKTYACDLVIAEVSHSSTGQGIELGWADILDIPIVCIYQDGAKISSSLTAVTKKFLMYTDAANMMDDITRLLKEYES